MTGSLTDSAHTLDVDDVSGATGGGCLECPDSLAWYQVLRILLMLIP